jgi:hypothetical protein
MTNGSGPHGKPVKKKPAKTFKPKDQGAGKPPAPKPGGAEEAPRGGQQPDAPKAP